MLNKYEHQKSHGFKKMLQSLTFQLTAITSLAGIVIYTALFSTYAPVHDTLHELRHALMFIPCH